MSGVAAAARSGVSRVALPTDDLIDGMMARVGPVSATDTIFSALKRVKTVVGELMDVKTDNDERWKSYALTLITHADLSDLHRERATRRAIEFLIGKLRMISFPTCKLDFLDHVSRHLNIPI